MPESFKEKRLFFKKGDQERLLREFMHFENMTHDKASDFFNIVPRSLTDWLREKTSLPNSAYEKIPNYIKNKYPPAQIKDKYWYTKIGGILGGEAIIKKYGKIPGDEEKRKKAHLLWWKTEGFKTCKITQRVKIKFTRNNDILAEIIGILLGDGGVNKYQIKVTLHKKDDYLYSKYVANLFEKTFGLKPSVIENKKHNFLNVILSSADAVENLGGVGLGIGHKVKRQVDVPDFIKQNNALSLLCVRGLVDTDGCFFIENHKNKYKYPRLNFTNSSKPLIDFVYKTLNKNNIKAMIRREHKAVQVENFQEICNYFKVVGCSNPKHLGKYNDFGGVA